ncbi:hypothetical protein PAMP_008547 [Pampus punctatissimus]
MSALKSGSTLQSLVLTPERIPSFLIPSRSPLLFSPRPHADRTRLLSDPDDSPGEGPKNRISPAASPRFLLRLPPPPRIRAPRRTATAEDADADTDLTTRAAMSLPHVEKVTTPYGFRAVLAASPCTRRRESLFHRNKPATVTVTGPDQPGSGPGRSRILRPVKALGLQVMKELKRPAAALRALSPAARGTHTR